MTNLLVRVCACTPPVPAAGMGREERTFLSQYRVARHQHSRSNRCTCRVIGVGGCFPAAARQSFKEQEALVYQQLAQLIRDGVWLKSYLAAVMRLEHEAFQVRAPACSQRKHLREFTRGCSTSQHIRWAFVCILILTGVLA